MVLATLNDLPAPPSNKTGWPWTEECPRLPVSMPDGKPWPQLSIVTPSYNQVGYIEETIRSVLLQGYPNLEYIIIDGVSTDGSVEIIKKYSPWLSYWVSEPDHGQSHALNKGFEQASGQILAYLNSDDVYYPGTFEVVISNLYQSQSDILIGSLDRVQINSNGVITLSENLSPTSGNWVHNFPVFTNGKTIKLRFLQPSMFWTRSIWEKTGKFDETLHFMMDREWSLRALALGAVVSITDQVLTRYLVHPGSKTHDYNLKFAAEMIPIYVRLSGLPEFRRLPCLLAALYYWLGVKKSIYYQSGAELRHNSNYWRSFFSLLMAKILRRSQLGVKKVAKL